MQHLKKNRKRINIFEHINNNLILFKRFMVILVLKNLFFLLQIEV